MSRRQRISAADKERLIAVHNAGDDYVELARHLGINRSTANRSYADLPTRREKTHGVEEGR